jgi:hypothetical protein
MSVAGPVHHGHIPRYQQPHRVHSHHFHSYLTRKKAHLAYKWPRAGNSVARRLWPIQLKLDTCIAGLVCPWEAHISGTESTCTGCKMLSWIEELYMPVVPFGGVGALDVDLSTFHVKLRAWVIRSRVQRNDLGSQEVPGS